MKIRKNLEALIYMLNSARLFHPEKEFFRKRIAIIGAADSVFDEKKGEYIDSHDIVIRINKAPYQLNRGNKEFLGSRTTHLFHSFFENDYSGGGRIDWDYFQQLGIQKIINPNCSRSGLLAHFNYYKRHRSQNQTYILNLKNHKKVSLGFGSRIPTVGFSALHSVLQSEFKEIYITGFTFFKTPYARNYRDQFLDMQKNWEHIDKQGLHDPEMEFQLFQEQLGKVKATGKLIKMDTCLKNLLNE